VAGIRSVKPISMLAQEMPVIYEQLRDIAKRLAPLSGLLWISYKKG